MGNSDIKSGLSVKRGYSGSTNEVIAVQELHDQIYQPDLGLVLFFSSSRYDLDKLGQEINKKYDVPVVGCTTSGEITPEGYSEKSITGISLSRDQFQAHSYSIENLDKFDVSQIKQSGDSVQTYVRKAQGKILR